MTGNGVKNYLKKYKRGCECGIVTRPKNVRARLTYCGIEQYGQLASLISSRSSVRIRLPHQIINK